MPRGARVCRRLRWQSRGKAARALAASDAGGAIGCLFGEHPHDEGLERGRCLRNEFRRWIRVPMGDGVRRLQRRVRVKRMPAGKDLMQNEARREHVAGWTGGLAAPLLGRGIAPGPRRQTGGRRHRVEVELAGQAKVDHFYIAIRPHHHVFRFEVAMDEASSVGELERMQDLRANADNLRQGQGLPAYPAQRRAFHQLHDDDERRLPRDDFMDRDDIGVVQRRRRSGFADEMVGCLSRAGIPGNHELQRHGPGQFPVPALIDLTETSAAQRGDDPVAADGPAGAPSWLNFPGSLLFGRIQKPGYFRQDGGIFVR